MYISLISCCIAGLLGTVGFGVFCLYLLLAVISGEMHIGMNFLFFRVHPMKYVLIKLYYLFL
jgi:hypothetical protein